MFKLENRHRQYFHENYIEQDLKEKLVDLSMIILMHQDKLGYGISISKSE